MDRWCILMSMSYFSNINDKSQILTLFWHFLWFLKNLNFQKLLIFKLSILYFRSWQRRIRTDRNRHDDFRHFHWHLDHDRDCHCDPFQTGSWCGPEQMYGPQQYQIEWRYDHDWGSRWKSLRNHPAMRERKLTNQ